MWFMSMHSGFISQRKDLSRIFRRTVPGENGTSTCMIRTVTSSRLRGRYEVTRQLSHPSLPTREDVLAQLFHLCLFIEDGIQQHMVHPSVPETYDLVGNLLW